MLQTAASIVCGVVIAFIYNWQFALFVFGIMPFKVLGSIMQIRIAKGFSMKNKADLEKAGKVWVLPREQNARKTFDKLWKLVSTSGGFEMGHFWIKVTSKLQTSKTSRVFNFKLVWLKVFQDWIITKSWKPMICTLYAVDVVQSGWTDMMNKRPD